MSKSNDKKSKQLGMPHGTAYARLRKQVLFRLLEKHNENVCFQCSKKIEKVEDLSLEHKIPWLDGSIELFWDLDNIAFSHLNCNIGASRPATDFKTITGTNNCNAKLTEDDVKEIREDTRTQKEIAKHYKVSRSAVQKIKLKINWGWLK
jgi:hypothetical protein